VKYKNAFDTDKVYGRKIVAGLTALLMLTAAALGSCTDSPGNAGVTDGTAPSEGTTESAETETEVSAYDYLPPSDYEGYAFVILTRDASHHTKEVYSEALNGEIINDAVFKRNITVEEKFNVNIEPLMVTETDESLLTRQITKSVMANDNSFDLALAHTVYAGAVALEGVLYNWNNMPYNDFSAEWWNGVLAKELTIQGHLYLAVSDMCISAVDYTWALVFNKKLCEDYSIENLYDLVKDKKWTNDKFAEVIKKASTDLNGDGKFGLEDRYGFATHYNSAICNWMFASDIKVVERDDEGWPVLSAYTEKSVLLTEKMYDILFGDNKTMYFTEDVVKQYGAPSHDIAVSKFFAENQALIAALRIYVIEELRSMETEFGIIPFPMFDEKQDGYYTHVDGHAPLMCLPKNLQNPERASVIIEALSYESFKQVMPSVYDIVLDSKYARDESSVEMLDIILDGRVYTFGYIYDNWKGMQWALTNLMFQKNSDYASYYAKNEKAALKQIETVINAFKSVIGE